MKYEQLELNSTTRSEISESFIELKNGYTHYQLEGDKQSELVVLVHGFSIPMFIWDLLYDFLIKQGFRVLRFDLFGRGLSDRPNLPNNASLFVDQLFELLSKLNLTQVKFNLIGLSMGGAISVIFTAQYPQLVRRLILFDPAGFPFENDPYPKILKIPGLNKLLFSKLAPKLLVGKIGQDFKHLENYPNIKERFLEQAKYKGYFRSILSTILNFPMQNVKKEYEIIGKSNIPVQLFWGEEDTTIPYAHYKLVIKAIPKIEFNSINDAAHIPFIDQPNKVNPLVLQFLKS